MNLQRRIPVVSGAVIGILAMLLGIMLARRFMPPDPSRSSSLPIVLGFAIIVIAFVVRHSFELSRYQMERHLLRTFLDHIPDNVFFKDRASRFVRISRSLASYFGLASPAQAIGKTDADFFSSEHADLAFADEQEIVTTGHPLTGLEEKETWPDGHESWVLTTKVPLLDHRGQIIGTMGISRDITDRKEAEARIHYLALHDGLTGLPNRTLLQDRIAQAIALAARHQRRVAVLMLDLDRFKNVNDSLGHYTGDRLLEAASLRLRSCLRESDIVGRMGGDEFIVCLPEVDGATDVETVAAKIVAAFVQPFNIDGHDLRVSASIGISQYPIDGEKPETLLQTADAAMYEAKKKVRGSWFFFTPELTEATRTRHAVENDLRLAYSRGEFVLHYQPLVAADLSSITGLEALLRWNHPTQGMIPPLRFIPHLEEMGLMVDVGRWVLLTACRQAVEWQRLGLPPVRMAVNISPQQFYRDDIVATVGRVLRETGIEPRWLELELTETLTLDDTETTIKIMGDLKQLGVSLSLDDFGTGWSSLSYLRRFKLDRIKIDQSFLRDITSQPAAEALVRTIISLGRNLGLTCVAEGVETRQQLQYLQKQKCSEIQGFLYSPALPPQQCEQLLRSSLTGLSWPAQAAQTAAPELGLAH